jgi:hypothetical protein
MLHEETFQARGLGALLIIFVAETCTNTDRIPRLDLNRNGWLIWTGISIPLGNQRPNLVKRVENEFIQYIAKLYVI